MGLGVTEISVNTSSDQMQSPLVYTKIQSGWAAGTAPHILGLNHPCGPLNLCFHFLDCSPAFQASFSSGPQSWYVYKCIILGGMFGSIFSLILSCFTAAAPCSFYSLVSSARILILTEDNPLLSSWSLCFKLSTNLPAPQGSWRTLW